MDDATLVREALGGSVPAFTAIFNQHVARVHDVATALLRDRKAAFGVVQATFREASERLESLQDPERLVVWLLAITRFHAALVAGEQAGLDRQPVATGDDQERTQQVGLVWEATADLALRERALLEFHLRQGLDGDDLADALGVSPAEVAEMRAGLPTIESGLAGYLTTRRADSRCADLPLVLRGWDGRFTHLIATHIAAHVDMCRVCREATATLPSPFGLYASAPQTPLPGDEGAPPPADRSRPAPDSSAAAGVDGSPPDARPARRVEA